MEPALVVVALWALFAGTHIGLAIGPLRSRLVANLGELGFMAVFYVVASASFAALVTYYAEHRFAGVPGLELASVPALRWPLMIISVAGFMFMVPALVVYPRLPAALFGQQMGAPRGIERVTRHPFFAGFALFALAHTLLATRLIGSVFFGGFALLSISGAWHQDRKLLARRGSPYAEYLAVTSAVPFAAVLSGRQRLVWHELQVWTLALGLGFALALRTWHADLFAHDGAWIIGLVLVGALAAGLSAWRRSRRVGAALQWAWRQQDDS